MKSFKFKMMAILVLLSITFVNAQMKNSTTATVKINGNCGMCKKTIEKAGNIKNIASVNWDVDSKIATLTFDSSKTNRDEILKRIADAGYDSETIKASNSSYQALPGCCQYDREITAEE
jgi:copper chaperone CopZ